MTEISEEGRKMIDPYTIVRRLTGYELISPKDARLLTEAVDGLIGEIRSKDARVKEIEAELVALSAENERLREALEYYGEQAGAIFSDEEEVNN